MPQTCLLMKSPGWTFFEHVISHSKVMCNRMRVCSLNYKIICNLVLLPLISGLIKSKSQLSQWTNSVFSRALYIWNRLTRTCIWFKLIGSYVQHNYTFCVHMSVQSKHSIYLLMSPKQTVTFTSWSLLLYIGLEHL